MMMMMMMMMMMTTIMMMIMIKIIIIIKIGKSNNQDPSISNTNKNLQFFKQTQEGRN
jgi:L-asparagine transporter-like permease